LIKGPFFKIHSVSLFKSGRSWRLILFLIHCLGNFSLMAQTAASPSSTPVKSLVKKTVEIKKGLKGSLDESGMKDPSLMELHLQFGGGLRSYLDQSLNDPNAAGHTYRLNSPVTTLSISSAPFVVPGGTQGIIQAVP
jgi:hypothetical protein